MHGAFDQDIKKVVYTSINEQYIDKFIEDCKPKVLLKLHKNKSWFWVITATGKILETKYY